MKETVFFTKVNDNDITLTSTSANHIANIAKESVQNWEAELENLQFYDTNMQLAIEPGNISNQIEYGVKNVSHYPDLLTKISKAKSLIAWLREGIKAKEAMIAEIDDLELKDYFNEIPESPKKQDPLTEKEYYASLPIKERNRYYQLEATAAVIGKFIHPDGAFAKARKALKDKNLKPKKVDGIGRDSVIYSFLPTISMKEVDDMFFTLQRRHREVQAELNTIKYACKEAIHKSKQAVIKEYEIQREEYHKKMDLLYTQFCKYQEQETNRIGKLKIVIPDSLVDIYKEISAK